MCVKKERDGCSLLVCSAFITVLGMHVAPLVLMQAKSKDAVFEWKQYIVKMQPFSTFLKYLKKNSPTAMERNSQLRFEWGGG